MFDLIHRYDSEKMADHRKMKKKGRAPRGSVSVGVRKGRLRLRWRYQGTVYQVSLGLPNTPLNYAAAQGKAALIESDIRLDRFDFTLARYQPPKPATPKVERPGCLMLWEQFTTERSTFATSSQAVSTRYKALEANLSRFGEDVELEAVARAFIDLLRSRQSPLTANQNLSLLQGFGAWCVNHGHWQANPFLAIAPLKRANIPNPKRLPLTLEEIRLILKTATNHPKWSAYHDFCMVLFYLGLRPSEAIGLKWKHLNWEKRTVIICESLARSGDGNSHSSARVTKSTKTGKVRTLQLVDSVYEMFHHRHRPHDSPDALIFTINGKAIDDRHFSKKPWKELLQDAGVAYRVPYAARVSFGSHIIESGSSVAQAALVMGNTPETMVRHYTHAITAPKMPEF